MWRKFTVYGLRFSKTSFWNRMNTGFLDPAVATVPTACGIETDESYVYKNGFPYIQLQQYLPLAVLKHTYTNKLNLSGSGSGCNSTYRLRYWNLYESAACTHEFELQQYLPLAVLKLNNTLFIFIIHIVATVPTACGIETKQNGHFKHMFYGVVATVPTACGIETRLRYRHGKPTPCRCNSTYRLRYWNQKKFICLGILGVCCNSTYRLRYWNL